MFERREFGAIRRPVWHLFNTGTSGTHDCAVKDCGVASPVFIAEFLFVESMP